MAKENSSDESSEKTPKSVPKKLIITDGNEESRPAKRIVIQEPGDDASATIGDTPDVSPEIAQEETKESVDVSEETVPESVASIEASESAEEPLLKPEEDTVIDKEMTIADAIAANESVADEPTQDAVEASVVDDSEDSAPTAEESAPENEQVSEADSSANPEEEFADKETAVAVDEIVANESDELLQRQDAEKQDQEQVIKKRTTFKEKLGNFWKNPLTKWGAIGGIVVAVVLAVVLPVSRYAILNAAGVRVKSSITVISSESQQPLKNVEVIVAGKASKTDDRGIAAFEQLKLGKAQIKITKRGYAPVEQTRVLGWGSNPLGKVGLAVSGTQFSFVVKDFLSSKGISSAEAVSGDFNASADKDGKIILPIDQGIDKDLEVTIKASEYRDEKVTIKLTDTGEKTVALVPSKKHIFVSKRNGKLDIYKIDADGKNESILLAATGSEREDLIVLPHPTSDYVAVVSTREGKRNKDGFLLSGLYVINAKTGESNKIAQSERIQLVDWTGDRIVYSAVTEGASAANAARSKLLSFEIGQPGAKELASANYFNDAVVFRGAVYYAPSSYAIPVNSVKFYKANPDGSGLTTLFNKEVWNIFRSDYDTLYLSVQQEWYELKSGSASPAKLSVAPTNQKSRNFKDNPDKKKALWVDTRDGKGVLLAYSVDSKKDETIETRAGLTQPVGWLNNTTVVFRVSDGREVADYVKSTEGGNAVKLRDVTNTDSAYYFN